MEPVDHVEPNGDKEDTINDLDEKIQELFDLVEQGYVFMHPPQYNKGVAYFYFVDLNGKDTVKTQVEMDKRTFDKVKSELEERMKDLYGFARLTPTQSGGKGKSSGGGRSGKVKTVVETELSRSYANFLRHLAEQVDWWTEAMNEIGFFATLTALQLTKVEPSKLYEQIWHFRNDPKVFVEFVKEHFVALLEAKKDAEALLKYREELAKLAIKMETVLEIARKYKNQRDKLLLLYNTAISVMCDKCKNKFLVSHAVMSVGGVEDGTVAD